MCLGLIYPGGEQGIEVLGDAVILDGEMLQLLMRGFITINIITFIIY